ncbi:MFS general substrate transporter [Purpureocillium lavendulum]|uniref:MFS general substrate transporter n=1 Tax=Purpureocillium lavendulum TaxID=1247861 RepID=A0AB34FQC6_9HYPO|nr:MFS general substrate transporter [Purpureocillium lavendulum]
MEKPSTVEQEQRQVDDFAADEPAKGPSNAHATHDVALQLVDTLVAGDVTPEEASQTLRRIDYVMMPVMFITYALQYMDKACLTGSALFGILTDLELIQLDFSGEKVVIDSSRYSYCSLIFYWGFLAGRLTDSHTSVVPGVFLCQKFPIAKYTSVIVFIWGGVTVCTVAVKSYPGLLAQRFFLGVTEAGLAPAFSLITVMWYKRREQPLRFAIWYSASGMGVLVGALLLYAIGQVRGPLEPWRYQFMVIGCVTSVWGILLWFILPDSPVNARFLSPRLRVVAIERLRFEQIGIENKTIKKDQIRETFTDPKTYFYMVMIFAVNLTNGATTGFGSIIVQSFGYPPLKTVLLLGGAGATLFISLLISGIGAVYLPNTRSLFGMLSCLPVIAGSVMVWKSDWSTKITPLWGFYLTSIFSTTLVMILTLMAANTAGHTKKAVTSGLVWASYCASNGIAPMTVRTQEQESHYPTAWKIILSMMSLVFVLLAVLRFYLIRLNKKKDSAGLVDSAEAARTAFMDMTDRANANFRYEL